MMARADYEQHALASAAEALRRVLAARRPDRSWVVAVEPVDGSQAGCDTGRGARVRHEPAGLGVPAVADGHDALLPDALLDGDAVPALEALGRLLSLRCIYRGEKVALEAPGRGARVDALADGEDLAARVLDALPRFKEHAHVAAHAREVCDGEAGVAALLDALDRFAERRPVRERQSAADVKFRRQELHRVAALMHQSGECGCGAFAAPGEREMRCSLFPEWGRWLEDLESRAEAAGVPHCRWGERPGVATPGGPACSSCQLALDLREGGPA